jgi:hypothetical protein
LWDLYECDHARPVLWTHTNHKSGSDMPRFHQLRSPDSKQQALVVHESLYLRMKWIILSRKLIGVAAKARDSSRVVSAVAG